MRLGMCSAFLPENINDFTPEICRRVRGLGFSGVFVRTRQNDPHSTTRAEAQRFRDLLADENLRLFQGTGYWQNLVTGDEQQRREAVRTLQAALRLAGWLGARGIDTGPGSMSPHGPWAPHPDNWTPLARRQLIRSLREAAPAAEDAGVYLSVECHQTVTLESPEVALEVIDAVGSPWVRIDYDSANWLDMRTAWDSSSALNHHFDLLGEHIVSCHAKDVFVEPRLVIHVSDGCAGRGLVDFRTLCRRMHELSPDYPVIIEGAETEDLPEVSAFFHGIAAELGLPLLDADEEAPA